MSGRKGTDPASRTGPLFPAPGITLTQEEISGYCTCTWVVTEYSRDGRSRSSLKYRDALCPAGRFHRALEARGAAS